MRAGFRKLPGKAAFLLEKPALSLNLSYLEIAGQQLSTMTESPFLIALAASVGVPIVDGKVILQPAIGVGWLTGIEVSDQLKILIRNFQLRKNWQQRQMVNKDNSRILSIAFHHVFRNPEDLSGGPEKSRLPSVLLTTIGWQDQVTIPANVEMRSIIIIVHADYLSQLVAPDADSDLLQAITSADRPILFEELFSPRIQEAANELLQANVPPALEKMFYRSKADELIYLFLAELLKRKEPVIKALNIADAKMIYQVRDKILDCSSSAPPIKELASFAGMSEAKLQRLFKQVFGSTIYAYYQSARMREAARLIREQRLTVSEVGYRLGYSNMSHFTRFFETHIGIKPKKFALSNK